MPKGAGITPLSSSLNCYDFMTSLLTSRRYDRLSARTL